MGHIESALSIQGVNKSFGGVPVLNSVSFELATGSITALAGENGAGKSTLMKIISGQIRANSGEIFHLGKKLLQGAPRVAHAAGISIVPQELAPYPHLAVYENLFVGREIRNKFGLLDHAKMKKESKIMLENFGLVVEPEIKMFTLSPAVTQLVEIIKATSFGAEVLLLDEPTSSITDNEVTELFKILRELQQKGVSMLYTTHRMSEIQEIADTIVVLRDGNVELNTQVKNADENRIVTSMVGRELDELHFQSSVINNHVRLRVDKIKAKPKFPELSFEIKSGEVLGFAGLIGAGRTEIVETIFGTRQNYSEKGTIYIDGTKIELGIPKNSISSGLVMVPEDRKENGLVLNRSVLENGSLPHLRSLSKYGWLNNAKRIRDVDHATRTVSLRSKGLTQTVQTLSGGNQQKVILARWLINDTKVLILDEPTRGVDVGARSEIYSIIRDLTKAGMAVLLVSSDMPELIGLSDRILVIKDGEVVKELLREEIEKEDIQKMIFRYASGLNNNDIKQEDNKYEK
jgi:ribose transport system ATP-binding protein